MQVVRKLAGVLAAIGICYGLLFRLQNYPFGIELIIIGSVFRGVEFLLTPKALRSFSPFGGIRKDQSRYFQILQAVSIAIIIMALVFRIQHYPGVSLLNLLGWNLLTVTLIIKAVQNPKKETEIDISAFGKKDDN